MDEQERKAIIQAAARVLAESAFALIQADPHQWSTRPCSTCRTVTMLIGAPFGCELRRK
jgi:cytidine deaminase